MFYSAQTGGFYSLDINGENMPDDVVEITAEEHATMLAGQSAGKNISSDKKGNPILIDPPPMTEDQMRESEILQDNRYLADTDYIVLKISEAAALGQDTSPLLDQYAGQLESREAARVRIRINEGRA